MHVTLKLCWVFVYVWSRWTAQISLKHSEFSLGFFLLLEFWPLFFFFSLGSQQTIPLILFCFCNSWHVMYARVCLDVCICDLALSRVKSSQPKPRRGSELLIRALVWEHLRWFQTLMLFVVQRRLSHPFPVCYPLFLSTWASDDAGRVSPLSASFTLLMEMNRAQNFIVSVALHGRKFSQ